MPDTVINAAGQKVTVEVVDTLQPFTVAIGTEPTRLFSIDSILLTYSLSVSVRTMGDATYVRLGNRWAQEDSMTIATEFRIIEAAGKVVNAAEYYAISDYTTDKPILEISGLYMPGWSLV